MQQPSKPSRGRGDTSSASKASKASTASAASAAGKAREFCSKLKRANSSFAARWFRVLLLKQQ